MENRVFSAAKLQKITYVAQYGSVKKIVGWVERSETQHFHDFVGLRCRLTQPTKNG